MQMKPSQKRTLLREAGWVDEGGFWLPPVESGVDENPMTLADAWSMYKMNALMARHQERQREAMDE